MQLWKFLAFLLLSVFLQGVHDLREGTVKPGVGDFHAVEFVEEFLHLIVFLAEVVRDGFTFAEGVGVFKGLVWEWVVRSLCL